MSQHALLCNALSDKEADKKKRADTSGYRAPACICGLLCVCDGAPSDADHFQATCIDDLCGLLAEW